MYETTMKKARPFPGDRLIALPSGIRDMDERTVPRWVVAIDYAWFNIFRYTP
jgi:hypothetical protein